MRKLVPHITDSDIFKTFSKQKGIPLRYNPQKGFHLIASYISQNMGNKNVPFLSSALRWCSFRQLIGVKRPKGWKAQCGHPSLHWKRERGCSFYLDCCLLLFFFGENMQDNMKTKFQQLQNFSVFLNTINLVLILWGFWWWQMYANIRVES